MTERPRLLYRAFTHWAHILHTNLISLTRHDATATSSLSSYVAIIGIDLVIVGSLENSQLIGSILNLMLVLFWRQLVISNIITEKL